MIIRKLPPSKIEHLFNREARAIKDKFGKYTSRYWPVSVGNGEYEIDYLPHKEFRVRRKGKPWTVISDTFTFFQSSFVNGLKSFYGYYDSEQKWHPNPGEEWAGKAIEKIADGKEQRNAFTYVTENERKYNN